ncbi:MAG: sulfotransferase [Gammaproteobacteria bacterium]|nr:sulfotransferase [Gammaproteobacteria bacterium]MBA3731149.1 sulfotransferase [Gammaproteobacteria bacterium]
MDTKVVFIMGPGHCGSTLLDLLLGSHSQSFSLGELNRLGSLIDARAGEYQKICGVCVRECDFWNRRAGMAILKIYFSQKNRLRSALGRAAQNIYNPYKLISRWSGTRVLIDSSKNPSWVKRRMAPRHTWRRIEPYLIYMCRDGRGVVNSYYRKYPERGMTKVIENWKEQITTMNAFYDRFPHGKTRVHYEALASQPEHVVRAICQSLGIEYEKGMLRYWEHEHHHVMGNGGTRSLIYKYREKFGTDLAAMRERQAAAKKFYDASFYDEIDIGIRLDERWRTELSREHREQFDAIAGDVNEACVVSNVFSCAQTDAP